MFTDIKYNYYSKTVENNDFIKVEIKDKKFGIIDVLIFHKDNDEYNTVEQFELPKKIIDELLSNDGYTKILSIPELHNLNKSVKERIEKIKDLNEMYGRVSNVLYHYYTVIREEQLFTIKTFNVNKFNGVREDRFNSKLIPYIMCDLLDLNEKYNNNLFYFDGDIFGQISEHKDFNLLSIIKVNEKTGECNLVGIYKLTKNEEIWDITMDIKMANIEKIIEKEIEKFTKRLEN